MKNLGNKAERQKEKILDKASKLFWQKGYHKTSIKDIAYSCRFEPSNIYYYFRKKEEMLYEVITREMNSLVQQIKHLENNDVANPIECLRSLISIHIQLLLGGTRYSYGLLHDVELRSLPLKHRNKAIQARDTYDRILRRIIRAGIDSGDFEEINEKLAGFAIVSMIVRSRIWFSPNGEFTSNEIADFMFEFALKGLRGDRCVRK